MLNFNINNSLSFNYYKNNFIKKENINKTKFKQINDNDYKNYSNAISAINKPIVSFGCQTNPTILKHDSPYIEIRKKLFTIEGHAFEELVADMFVASGEYDDVILTPPSNDGGVDIILEKNGKKTIIQCKNIKDNVRIDEFYALDYCKNKYNADNTIMIASSGVCDDAFKLAESFGYDCKIMNLDDVIKYADEHNFELTDETLVDYNRNTIISPIEKYKDEIIELHQQGKIAREIINKLNLNLSIRYINSIIQRWKEQGCLIEQEKESEIEQNKNKIIELHQQGKSAPEIITELGLDYAVNYVNQKLRDWEIQGDFVRQEKKSEIEQNKDKIIELHQQGKSAPEIITELGLSCCSASINNALQRWEEHSDFIRQENKSEIEKNKDKIIELYLQGKTAPEIITELRLSCKRFSIYPALKRWKKHGDFKESPIITVPQQRKKQRNFEKQERKTEIEQNKEKIIELHLQGKTAPEIITELGLVYERSSVTVALQRWEEQGDFVRVKVKRQSEIEKYKDKIIVLHLQGKSAQKIINELELSCSSSAIYTALRRWNIQGDFEEQERKTEIEQNKEKIIELHLQGKTAPEIITILNLRSDRSSVASALKRWNIKKDSENINLSLNENLLNIQPKDFRLKIAELLKNEGYKISGDIGKNMFTAERNGKTYIVKCINNKKPLGVGNLRTCAGYIDKNNKNLILAAVTGIKSSKEIDEILEQYKDKLKVYII